MTSGGLHTGRGQAPGASASVNRLPQSGCRQALQVAARAHTTRQQGHSAGQALLCMPAHLDHTTDASSSCRQTSLLTLATLP